MRSRSGVSLFNKYDHQLLQSISARNQSQENIQPISITDIDQTYQNTQFFPVSERPAFISSSRTDCETIQIPSPTKIKQKNDEQTPKSPAITITQTQNQNQKFQEYFDNSQTLFDECTSYSGRQRTQIRAVALTKKQSEKEKSVDYSFKELDNSVHKPEQNMLIKKVRPSVQSFKNMDRHLTLFKTQSDKYTSSFPKSRQTDQYPPQQSFKGEAEVEESQFINLKKTIRNQISKVLLKLLDGTFSRRYYNLTTQHLKLIRDRSHHIVNEEKMNQPNLTKCLQFLSCKALSSTLQLKQMVKRIIYKIPVIQPTHRYNICLNIISMISLISLYFLYSLSIFFFYTGSDYTIGIEVISIFISILEMISKFFVGIYNKGEIVLDRNIIFKNYIKSTFFIDLFSLSSVIISSFKMTNNYYINSAIQSIFFTRILSTKQVFQRMDHLIHIVGKANNLYQLFKLVFKLVILCHIISSLFHIAAVIEQSYFDQQDTWLDNLTLNNSIWYEKYIFAFFYSFNTIMLNTNNNLNAFESLFTIIIMCSTIGTFAYIMSSISDILESDNKKKREFKSDLETINQYMRKKNLKKEIQSKVCNFLEYLYEEKGDIKNNKDAIHVLKRLPLNLREDIQQDINQKVVESFSWICNTFSEKVKRRTVQIIEEECFLPNEIIFKQGSFNNQALYLVQKGKVFLENVNSQGGTITFSIQEKNGIFGEKNFFSGLAFDFQARCGDYTTVYKIPRKEFIDILQSSTDDFEQFCVTRDSILNENNSPFLTFNCKICQSKYHTESLCDKVHFISNSSLIIKKYLYEEPAERKYNLRKLRLRMNAVHFINQMRDVCDRITSNEEYIPILEAIELDSAMQYQNTQSFSDDDGGDSDDEDDDEEDEDEDDDQDNYNQNPSLSHKIVQQNLSNQIIEEGEDNEDSPKNNNQQKKNSIMNDDFSLSQVQNTQQSPKLTYQNSNFTNNSFQITYNNMSNIGGKSTLQNKSNPNLPSNLSNSNLPHQLSSQNKISQVSRNLQLTDDIFKSRTLNSQNTSQSAVKGSKIQIENEPYAEQKSAFFNRKQRKQKCVVIPKSISKSYSKHYTEQFTNQSSQGKQKIIMNEGEFSQFTVYQQLTKMNTLIEKQISQIEPSIKISIQPDINQNSNQLEQQNEIQMGELKQQMKLFDQIKQNLLEFQKQIPINNALFLNEFERMKKYRIYFPLGNYTYIISNLNKNLRIQIKNAKRRTHIKTWTFMDKLSINKD